MSLLMIILQIKICCLLNGLPAVIKYPRSICMRQIWILHEMGVVIWCSFKSLGR
jgi:hypothetical protein